MKKLCRKETHLFFGSQEEQDKKKKKKRLWPSGNGKQRKGLVIEDCLNKL